MTRLLIIRHGNTFEADEEPRRVGSKTDLPLTQSGIEQARALGGYMKLHDMVPDTVFASELQRAQQTAQIMMHDAGVDMPVQIDTRFNEIDHGPDENKTEGEIIERIGQQALDDWNEFSSVPDGWVVNPRDIQQSWIAFGEECVRERKGQTTCVVSSGGIIRFAPVLLPEPIANPKVKTASMSLFVYDGQGWSCPLWNKRAD
jgi:probable phosphoglycerate mutase